MLTEVQTVEDLLTSCDIVSSPEASAIGRDDVLDILALNNLGKDVSYPLADDLKLPTGKRLLTVCLSINDGERCGLGGIVLLLLEEEPGLFLVFEPSGVGVRSASVGVAVSR